MLNRLISIREKLAESMNEVNAAIQEVDNTLPPTPPVPPILPQEGSVVFNAKFANKDLRELTPVGGFINQNSGTWKGVSIAGKDSIGLTINTTTKTGAAYLFFWKQALIPLNKYFFSASYYIPSGIQPGDWWNIQQWKSTYDGNTDNSVRTVALGIETVSGKNYLYLSHRPTVDNETRVYYPQILKTIPFNTWFTLKTYYEKAKNNTGKVIVWQDNMEIYNISGVPTIFADGILQWSVNNYADKIVPNICTIYVADMKITNVI